MILEVPKFKILTGLLEQDIQYITLILFKAVFFELSKITKK